MALRQLDSADAALGWFAERGVRGLTIDSRQIKPGDAFMAWPGQQADGRGFVAEAFAAGAAACLIEADGAEAVSNLPQSESLAAMPGLKEAAGPIASVFMGQPSARLKVFTITGTNGKTSTAWWLAQALGSLGQRCGLIGTIGAGEPPSPLQPAALRLTGMTTPDAVTLQTSFKQFADAGFKACVLEATSIGLAEHRLAGTQIDVAVFTNFTQDHLDYHGSMAAYWQAKAQLFEARGLSAAVVNVGNEHGAALAERLRQSTLDLWTYAVEADARLSATQISYGPSGLAFDLREGDQIVHVKTQVLGDYNAENLLAAIGAMRAHGIELADAAAACALLLPVPGRMQRLVSNASGPQVVVDYAHTPDALQKALLALQPFARERQGVLWCVFGCGGNRDAGKRPLMGAIAQQHAQHVVVTTDNPRREAPAEIARQIVAGMQVGEGRSPVALIEDRREAIAHAVREAEPCDVILIAGKGHEAQQEIAGVKHPFSDAEEASRALAQRAERGQP